MTPRERFLTAIKGEEPDRLALTIWNNKLPGGEIDDKILDLGVCVIVKSSVWKMEYKGITVEQQDEKITRDMTRRTLEYHTEYGTLREVKMIEPGTSWIKEFMFKSPGDYKALKSIISARHYFPDHDRFLKDDRKYGDQSVARPVTIHSPFQELIYEFMGMDAFSMEYAMNPEKLSGLEAVLGMDWQERISMVADSPAHYAIIEGNTDSRVISPSMFRDHFHPFIEVGCQRLHDKNILAGAHLDSNNKGLATLFAETEIDFIESFTPPPDCDMSIPDARRAWPDKSLQIHFPSSVHLWTEDKMKDYCQDLTGQLEGKKAIVLGVSEDVPNRGIKTLIPMFTWLMEQQNKDRPEKGDTGVAPDSHKPEIQT